MERAEHAEGTGGGGYLGIMLALFVGEMVFETRRLRLVDGGEKSSVEMNIESGLEESW